MFLSSSPENFSFNSIGQIWTMYHSWFQEGGEVDVEPRGLGLTSPTEVGT